MGAELIIVSGVWPTGHQDKPLDPDIALASVLGAIELLDESALNDVRDYHSNWTDFTGSEQDEMSDDEVREYLAGCAGVVFDLSRRDISWIQARGLRLIVAGGDSWGDDPSDSFGYLAALVNAGLLD